MKRRIDQNRPSLRNSIPWRMMLGAVLLCLMTSLNSFGQAAQLSVEEIQDLQIQINQLENKMANPAVANNVPVAEEFSERIILMKKRLMAQMAMLQTSSVKDYAIMQQWIDHTEAEQLLDQEVVATENQKDWIQWQIDNTRIQGGPATLGNSLNP